MTILKLSKMIQMLTKTSGQFISDFSVTTISFLQNVCNTTECTVLLMALGKKTTLYLRASQKLYFFIFTGIIKLNQYFYSLDGSFLFIYLYIYFSNKYLCSCANSHVGRRQDSPGKPTVKKGWGALAPPNTRKNRKSDPSKIMVTCGVQWQHGVSRVSGRVSRGAALFSRNATDKKTKVCVGLVFTRKKTKSQSSSGGAT